MPAQQRADARRNYARILAVAEREVAAHGAHASLEQIARTAGVGSATVRRHFPTRRALVEAVSATRVEALRVRAGELADLDDSRDALLTWLGEVVVYCATARGLAAALTPDDADAGTDAESPYDNSCATVIEAAGTPLLRRAARDGAVPEDVTMAELLTLLVGIALATEHRADPEATADRLFRLVVAGISPGH
ncbi:helix-turn-helix domain-containing protein [Streptomyces sp. DSM 44915]|uniref:Helix-turn-helix domain-containing protein n=1 Tax=Streptomyces chisholmiae TaxID=3075540 RepID=A0ABU2JIG8_9ACTN|nr:helix-turn-helix domain-containing protein [Streptomyces sp. DSM 44915]MDT0264782.1 helix-turn-helix domain-containing protein [Streptomyces sp. DSM 44915]